MLVKNIKIITKRERNGVVLRENELTLNDNNLAFFGICFTTNELPNATAYYNNTKIRKKWQDNAKITQELAKLEQTIINNAPCQIASVGCWERHRNGLPHKHSLLICKKENYNKIYIYLQNYLPKQALTPSNKVNFVYVLKKRCSIGKVSGVQSEKYIISIKNTQNFDEIIKQLKGVANTYWTQFCHKSYTETYRKNGINRLKKIIFNKKNKRKKENFEIYKKINLNKIETKQGYYHLEADYSKLLLTQTEFKKLKSKSKKCKKMDKKTTRKFLLGWATYYINKRPKVSVKQKHIQTKSLTETNLKNRQIEAKKPPD